MSPFRHVFIAALLALTCAGTVALAQDGLPLAERRAHKTDQDDVWPGQPAAIRRDAGLRSRSRSGGEAVARPGQADRFAREGHSTKIYFTPLTEAVQGVASDALGRQSLKGRLRQIVATCDKATAPPSNHPNGLSFADGVLTIDFEPGVNENDVEDRAKAIRALLESKL